MICPNCGNKMSIATAVGSFYCKKCGKYIASTNARVMEENISMRNNEKILLKMKEEI